MPYRSTDKTRQKKDAKRTAMMQAAGDDHRGRLQHIAFDATA